MSKSNPLLFNSAMALAVLSGAKTQTRRPQSLDKLRIKMRHHVGQELFGGYLPARAGSTYAATLNRNLAVCANTGHKPLGIKPGEFDFVCPYASGATSLVNGKWVVESVGDSIWGRETFSQPETVTYYKCDEEDLLPPGAKWTPSIHMPRYLSRIVKRVSCVRLEWLRNITQKDAIAEGIPRESKHPVDEFKELWTGIYGDKWPWETTLVWVILW